MARGWFVIQVYTGYEKRVYNTLSAKMGNPVLKNVLLQVRLPEEEYTIEKKGKRIAKKRLIYPGYVLAEMDLPSDEAEWKKIYAEVKGITGVGIFLSSGGGNRKPAPLDYDEVKSIFEKTGEIKSNVTRLESGFEAGERVRVTDGPFKGFEGEIEEIYNEKGSLMVRVEIFGRMTPVELTFNQVSKA